MIKTLNNIFKQDKEKFVVPKGVQDCIPVMVIYDDGIFKVGKDKYSKSFKFTDINYAVASREDKEGMFLEYSELLNSLDSGATTKITINNRRLNRLDFEKTILIPETGDNLDEYREEYNKMLLEKATGANSTVQDKYVTISINKKNVDDARTYFARVGADLIAHFNRFPSCECPRRRDYQYFCNVSEPYQCHGYEQGLWRWSKPGYLKIRVYHVPLRTAYRWHEPRSKAEVYHRPLHCKRVPYVSAE